MIRGRGRAYDKIRDYLVIHVRAEGSNTDSGQTDNIESIEIVSFAER